MLKEVQQGTARTPYTYLYGPDGQVMGQVRYTTAGRKSQASYYVWLDSLPIAQIDLTYSAGTTIASTTLTYLHSDHLNTPRLATNQGGNLVWSWPSDAFGVGQPNNHGSTIDVILRFPGQVADAHSGLYYNYFRDYDAETGRYVESDPIGLKGGLNTYGYTMGNPLNSYDFFGLEVSGHYQKSTGEVFLYDSDTKQMVSGTFESGGKPYGDPAPDGTYTIYETPRDDFFRLDPQDETPNDDINQANGRWGIRLHKPGRTVGCIAATDAEQWGKIKPFLLSTKTTPGIEGSSIKTVPILNRAGLNIIYGSTPDTLVRYGTLYVIP
ncbi:RHS repeat-associated core domain-containing protein [Metapseudomonas otitidis]|uniref:RHS repeat-associated core domain-containing protein n=1 Tax=Metapseudomonas otitidis TaxID=319939 RepID=UPI0039B5DBB7